MPWRPHGQARVNPSNPEAFAICDRCGGLRNHVDLAFQFDYRGEQLKNTGRLVCRPCTDIPQEQLRPRIIPPDPPPIMNARPENYAVDEA